MFQRTQLNQKIFKKFEYRQSMIEMVNGFSSSINCTNVEMLRPIFRSSIHCGHLFRHNLTADDRILLPIANLFDESISNGSFAKSEFTQSA